MKQSYPAVKNIASGSSLLRPDGTSFWQFLKKEKIAYQKDHFPFLTAHKIPRLKEVYDFEAFMALQSRGQALAYLYQGFGRSLDYVGPVLDSELEHGFNDHTDRHTLWVSQVVAELLHRSGKSYLGKKDYNEKTEVLATLVGMTHDIGNFVSRKEHSTYSAWMLGKLFGNTYSDVKAWEAVEYSILFHEEPVLVQQGVHLSDGIPLQWALVLADKMHVGRDRIGGRSVESGVKKRAFDKDVHILLNALIVRSTWYFEVNTFVWHLDFSVDQLGEKFASFSKGNKRLWLPRFFQKHFLKKGTIYRESFAKLFSDVYGDRMSMAAESAFLLFPYINTFKVRLVDNDTRQKVGSGEMVVWEKKR
ncbi:MAG: hypothetical protein H6774_02280 [Pseudomonadales bacterium]|nr:hypothetical protein [Candidatus Woesebacteria bacterium]MCB9801894.1 hypothetical protein [Pseudomonadales bacterium]